jgi:hypothetical protein
MASLPHIHFSMPHVGLDAIKPSPPVTRIDCCHFSLLREEHLGCRRSNHKRADDLGPILKASQHSAFI